MKKMLEHIPASRIKRQITEEGESIEEMVRRCIASNEPIEATAPMIYTEEADGVQPQYDPRTDRFDLALDAIEKFQKSEIAKTQESAAQEAAEAKAQAEAAQENG